jgi:uncharacterized protein YyaL (SSP411 family)
MRRLRMRQGIRFAVLVSIAIAAISQGDEPSTKKANKPRNRLAKETSPYLLQHASNPVDWFAWGPEAFAKAKKEGKLVFLSIGYSSCHWCHVMERESFENGEVAKRLNDWFVSIKVDREERPDIDAVYMTALNVLGNRGGWPLSMFLTADGKPIVGGTYWPPEDRVIEGQTVRGFKSILRSMHQWQVENAGKLVEQAERLSAATRNALGEPVHGNVLVDLNRSLVDAAIVALRDEFDGEYGGFGSAARRFQGSKFPVPCYLRLLLHEAQHNKSGDAAAMIELTLDRMARGGIYDQLGGGFHRYSTERTWTVPHFEKMLYDNAQMVEVFSEAYRLTHKQDYRRVVEDTLAFVQREMTSPEGAFYSALDADSDGDEGRFYVWTAEQIDAALPDRSEAALFKKAYSVDGKPNFESKAYVLVLSKPIAELAKDLGSTAEQLTARLISMRRQLLEIRGKRPRPFLDTKVLTGWNGEMIAAWATAGRVFAEPKYIAIASRAADFVLHKLRTQDGRLLHSYAASADGTAQARLDAYLDDYAYFVHGLLALHEASGKDKWLQEGKTLSDRMVQLFGDKNGGGFFFTSNDHEPLFARSKDQYDSAQPSGNSVAVRDLVALGSRTRDARYLDLAMASLKAFAAPLKSSPTNLTAMVEALALSLDDKDNGPASEGPTNGVAGAPQEGGKKSDAMVKTTAEAAPPDAGGKQVVTITMSIEPGWHIYANPVGQEDLESVQTDVKLEPKNQLDEVKVEYPPGKVVDDKVLGKYKIFEGQVEIKATIKRKAGDKSPLEVTAKFQSCNDKQCLLPATVKVKVTDAK